MADLARKDILDILPNSLANSFAIIIDDYHRPTIQKMAQLVEQCLSDAGIEFESGTYQGEKWTRVIASVDNSFLCSM